MSDFYRVLTPAQIETLARTRAAQFPKPPANGDPDYLWPDGTVEWENWAPTIEIAAEAFHVLWAGGQNPELDALDDVDLNVAPIQDAVLQRNAAGVWEQTEAVTQLQQAVIDTDKLVDDNAIAISTNTQTITNNETSAVDYAFITDNAISTNTAAVSNHAGDVQNPHQVTSEQLGALRVTFTGTSPADNMEYELLTEAQVYELQGAETLTDVVSDFTYSFKVLDGLEVLDELGKPEYKMYYEVIAGWVVATFIVNKLEADQRNLPYTIDIFKH